MSQPDQTSGEMQRIRYAPDGSFKHKNAKATKTDSKERKNLTQSRKDRKGKTKKMNSREKAQKAQKSLRRQKCFAESIRPVAPRALRRSKRRRVSPSAVRANE
jgi:phage protein D